ncbi:MAG: NAAT family transporter [Epsilonproteobacteria bacterium]|nr:NAAT family transporter [Campylobacterota bacterium]
MINQISLLSHDIIALITILNPIAGASIMMSIITRPTTKIVHAVALKATLTVVISSLITLFSGEFIFKLFGINVSSLKVIGGIILMIIAINMAHGETSKTKHTQEEQSEAEEKEEVAIVPLGIPILFGPGVIATIIVLNSNHANLYSPIISYILVSIAIVISSLVVYLTLRYAGTINKILGVTGMKILTRIMGLIVGAIATQFILSGTKALWSTF